MKSKPFLYFLLGVLMSLVSSSVNAQSTPLLDTLFALRDQQQALSLPFEHRLHSVLFQKPQTRCGVFYFDGDATVIMHYTTPTDYVFLIRDGSVFHMQSGDNKLKPMNVRNHPMVGGMAKVLRLEPVEIKRMFQVSERSDSETEEILLDLEPRRKAPVSRMILHADAATGDLHQLRLDEVNGDSQVIVFDVPHSDPPDTALFDPAYWIRYYSGEKK